MKSFDGRLAVVTGAGMGLGRELARQLAAQGCSVAMCDISRTTLEETVRIVEQDGLRPGVRLSIHVADVSDESQLIRFRDELAEEHGRRALDLLVNNAGIGGTPSFIHDDRERWDKIFDVCWRGVYLGCRVFLSMLLASKEAHIANIASANGFWASVGPGRPYGAYASAKFAVKGFTEALITDLRLNAPNITCSVSMPGHIGTSFPTNSRKSLAGNDDASFSEADIARGRVTLSQTIGEQALAMNDGEIRALLAERERRYLEDAPLSPAAAAEIVLSGIRAGKWRILVGEDAAVVDQMVRESPEDAYEPEFFDRFCARVSSVGSTLSMPASVG